MRWFGPFYRKKWDTYFFRTASSKGEKYGLYLSIEHEMEDIQLGMVSLEKSGDPLEGKLGVIFATTSYVPTEADPYE